MDLRQLRYFVALATQQHYGRASSVLHVAQPALSRQIHLLEDELGVKLFERHARGATPTPEALLLLERATAMLQFAEQTKQDMLALQKDPSGPVSIGLSPALAMLLAVPLARELQRLYPDVTIRIVESFAHSLRDALLQGTIDVAVLNGPIAGNGLVLEPLVSENACLIGPAGDPHLMERSELSVHELKGVPLILTGIAKSGVRLELEAAAASGGVSLLSVIEVEGITSAISLVKARMGLTVHFSTVVRNEIAAGELAAVPVRGVELTRAMARAANRPVARATDALMRVLRGIVADLVRAGRWPHARLLGAAMEPALSRP